jgi:tetratricopeptide (TPR) repeat protein
LELAQAAGDNEQAEELRLPARRFLALAGERALGLDTAQAEARLAKALELAPAGDPEHERLLVRWADTVAQAGRPRDAVEALDEALVSLRERGEIETTAQALQIRSRATLRLGDGQGVETAIEAVELLERESPGPALVAAYTQLSAAEWLSGSYAEGISAADRALELAAQLGLQEPARALGYRGMARAYLGEDGAIGEMERAFAMLLESGAGRDAATIQNNLAIARYPLEGVAPSLAAFEAGIGFCHQRGLVEAEWVLLTNRPGLLAELGRPDEALAEVGRLAEAVEPTGQTDLVELRAVEFTIRVARGERPAVDEIEWLVEKAVAFRHVDVTTYALGCAAAVLVSDDPRRARRLLEQLLANSGSHQTPYFARTLPAMVRTALTAGDDGLANRLVDRLELHDDLDEHAVCTSRAQLAEQAGDLAAAARLYADAARRWGEFGNLPERAQALLGLGRCLCASGLPGAEESLREARMLFDSMRFEPAIGEVEQLLELAAGAPAP